MAHNALQHMLNKAWRREMVNRLLRGIGWGAALAAAAGLILLLVDRLGGARIPEPVFWGVLIGGALGGAIWAFIHRPRRLEVAVHLDRELRLKDRIGSAATLDELQSDTARRGMDPEFAALLRQDVERIAAAIDVRPATPIHVTPVWGLVIPLAILLWAGVLFLPSFDWARAAPRAEAASPEQVAQAQQGQELAQSIQQATSHLEREVPLDDRSRANLEALERLAQQLENPASPEELARARDESAAHLSELAEEMARQSQRDLAAAEEVARRFAGMDALDAPRPPMSAREFHEALRRGDFGEAARRLEELMERPDLPEAERHEIAEHLRELASHLEQEMHKPQDHMQEQREQLAQALRDQGMDEEAIDEMLNSPPPTREEIERELREQNIDEEVARRLARELQQQQEQRRIQEQAEQSARDVTESLHDAAERMDPAAPEPPAPPAPPQEPEASPEQEPGASEQTPRPDQATPEQRRPQDQQSREGQPQEGQPQEGQPQQDQPREGEPREGQQPREGEQPREQPRAGTGQPREDQPQPAPQPQPGQQPDQTPRDQTGEPQPGDAQPDQPREGQREVPRHDPDSPEPGEEAAQPQPQAQDQQPQSPAERLRRMAEQRQAAEQRRQASERMKQTARELAEQMTPEERQEWARQWQREMGRQPQDRRDPDPRIGRTPRAGDEPRGEAQPLNGERPEYQTHDLDLRGDERPDQLITEWLQRDVAAPVEQGGRAVAPAPVRQAQEVAERAVNEAAVQRRYHRTIKRYFDRLNETVERAANP